MIWVVTQGQYCQNLKPLLDSLVLVSTQKGFVATTQNTFTGTFQCRGDLSNAECYNYVSKIPNMLGHLCGGGTGAAERVLPMVRGGQVRRDVAFGMMENNMQNNKNLFYTGSYQSLYVLGQCEGILGNADCGGCIKSVMELASSCSPPLHESIPHSA
ncbi:plasmodesmata-located protein 1-like [Glycine soja]|uniref:plasmodesmata-located protein 1-like n=1 Tax=Glycine soja TaxID=3848 RepID=UPI00103FE76A|nr:plasmodesmata-located protein 1-like [Glycine soja]